MSRFDRIEKVIAHLVEGSFARLFSGRLHPHEVAVRLAHAIDENAYRNPDGSASAPQHFIVRLNTDDYAALLAEHPDLAEHLRQGVINIATRANLRLSRMPQVQIESDASLQPFAIHIQAAHDEELSGTTDLSPTVTPPSLPIAARKPHLMYNGHYIPLDRPVINIGRRKDNHIVIEGSSISRHHAQLRLRFGRYVIYDLNSRGGTFVNGHRISECILKPNDVIRLSQASLLYLEDEVGSESVWRDTDLRPPEMGDTVREEPQ
ncbi:MAG: DUF3662 and FHA domain-containing protein [Anaerolineae bacterium]